MPNRTGKGIMRGRGGKLAGFSAIVVPIAGFIINDLKKPDGIIKGLFSAFRDGYRDARSARDAQYESSGAVDITDQVEIVDID